MQWNSDQSPSTDATLELTILSATAADTILRRPRHLSAAAFIDPSLKSTTIKNLDGRQQQQLHIPIFSTTLQNPNSRLTIELFFVPKLPLSRNPKLFGSAHLKLSLIPATGDCNLTLPLYSSSGKSRGSVSVCVRVLWSLGSPPPVVNGFLFVQPSAPPEPVKFEPVVEENQNSWFHNNGTTVPDRDCGSMSLELASGGSKVVDSKNCYAGRMAPTWVATETILEESGVQRDLQSVTIASNVQESEYDAFVASEIVLEENGALKHLDSVTVVQREVENVSDSVDCKAVVEKGNGALRNFLAGLICGTVAVVVAGVAALAEN